MVMKDKTTNSTRAQQLPEARPSDQTQRRAQHSCQSYNTKWIVIALWLPALLAYLSFRYLTPSAPTSDHDSFTLTHIDVSKVLKQNLILAKHPWEHGVLTHALLELQNPELTVFAGPGYGVDLRNPSKLAGGKVKPLEAFPGGQLPKCGGGLSAGGNAWGKYDEWVRVKGLRYAASKIDTTPIPETRVRGGRVMKQDARRQWLIREGDSAADAASLGWAALLLERAGANDPTNPVGAGRNVYEEAADEMVRYLVEENAKFVLHDQIDASTGEGPKETSETKEHRLGPLREVGQEEGRKWAISHRADSPQLWADFVFMVPPFLAAYAVARQDDSWLLEAVTQIEAYHEVLSLRSGDRRGFWKHIVDQRKDLEDCTRLRDEGLWLTGNAWALAGIVRVLAVLHRWDASGPEDGRPMAAPSKEHHRRRDEASKSLHGMANLMLESLRIQLDGKTGLLKNYLDVPGFGSDDWAFGEAAGSALLVSSIYRLAQIEQLQDLRWLEWADELYNIVAEHIDKQGMMKPVTIVSEIPAKQAVNGTSEGQSFAIMMWTARRDCARTGTCRTLESRSWSKRLRGLT